MLWHVQFFLHDRISDSTNFLYSKKMKLDYIKKKKEKEEKRKKKEKKKEKQFILEVCVVRMYHEDHERIALTFLPRYLVFGGCRWTFTTDCVRIRSIRNAFNRTILGGGETRQRRCDSGWTTREKDSQLQKRLLYWLRRTVFWIR